MASVSSSKPSPVETVTSAASRKRDSLVSADCRLSAAERSTTIAATPMPTATKKSDSRRTEERSSRNAIRSANRIVSSLTGC